eukprot:214748-Pyramimonas_sp.AAC.2
MQYRRRRQDITDVLDEAWRSSILKEAHRLVRLLACKGRAPGGRNLRHLQGAKLSAGEWLGVRQLAGPLGGMGAEEVAEEELNVEEILPSGCYGSFAVAAKVDLGYIAKSLRHAPQRLACPPWSVPVEIWGVVTDPKFGLSHSRYGVGADFPLESDALQPILEHGHACIRVAGRSPSMWNRSFGCAPPRSSLHGPQRGSALSIYWIPWEGPGSQVAMKRRKPKPLVPCDYGLSLEGGGWRAPH